MKPRLTVTLCAAFMLIVGVATASAGNGGNSANAHLCQKGGWMKLVGSDGTSFADQDACVSYAAQGGTLAAKSQSQLDCESFGGTFGNDDQLGLGAATIFWTCNGFAYTDDGSLYSEGHVLEEDCRNDGGYALDVGTGGVADATCYLSAG